MKKNHFKQYVIYIGLAVLLTSILNKLHNYFIDRDNGYLLHIAPTLAGIVFGYLITRVVILNKKLGRLATIDTLTGAFNRMQFDQLIEAEIERAERLRTRIEQHSFGKAGHLTCSFGVTEYRKDFDDSRTLLKRADEALYRAKETGRNRVMQSVQS